MNDKPSADAAPAVAMALDRVRRRRGFYLHLLPYAVVVSLLALANLWLTPHYPWVLWVAAGWGIGLCIHGVVATGALFGRGWERRQVRKLLARRG